MILSMAASARGTMFQMAIQLDGMILIGRQTADRRVVPGLAPELIIPLELLWVMNVLMLLFGICYIRTKFHSVVLTCIANLESFARRKHNGAQTVINYIFQ